VPSFETIFHVSPLHRLVLVKSRSRGGDVSGVYWEHEEYDGLGRLIARYHCFKEVDGSGAQRCGWCQYDVQVRPVVDESLRPELVPS
jgi:hypothetical protein